MSDHNRHDSCNRRKGNALADTPSLEFFNRADVAGSDLPR